MSINKGVDKEDVVYVYGGILLSLKKEWNNATCGNMDGPRMIILSELSSERER